MSAARNGMNYDEWWADYHAKNGYWGWRGNRLVKFAEKPAPDEWDIANEQRWKARIGAALKAVGAERLNDGFVMPDVVPTWPPGEDWLK